jgi:hypothetical protein
MNQSKWVWMGHAGHLIVAHDCRFHLSTYVGLYLVSTVGEYWPDKAIREIHASVHDSVWLKENSHRQGDDFDTAYFKRFGYETIGFDRRYETMVFQAKPSNQACCPWVQVSGTELDFSGYNTAEDAYKGHMSLCYKWTKKAAKKA